MISPAAAPRAGGRALLVCLLLAATVGVSAVLEGGTYLIKLEPSVAACPSVRGYLTAPVCTAPGQAPVGAQPTLLAGNGRLLQLWNLFPNATSSWNNVQGQPLRIENLGRKNATTAALNCASLLWMNPLAGQCTSLTGALVVPNALPFWVLEAGPAKDKYYIRSAACAAGTPSYLGMAKQDCARTQPMLFNRTNPWGDLVWTLELASAGMPRILNITQTGAAGKFNVVTVLVRAAPGPNVSQYRLVGTPATPGAPPLQRLGPGQPGGAPGLVKFVFEDQAVRGETYFFRIQAYNELGWGPVALPAATFKVPARPSPPTEVTIGEVQRKDGGRPVIVVDFFPPANDGGAEVNGFQVLGKPIEAGPPNVYVAGMGTLLMPIGMRRLEIATYSPLTRYNFQVWARNTAGWGDPSTPPVVYRAPNDGSCGLELDPCANSTSCCFMTPALYCQKATLTALQGNCQTCVELAKYGCSGLDSCCGGAKCQKNFAANPSGLCRECIAITKHGCADLADCCTGRACQRDAAADAQGSCVACVGPQKFGCFNSTTCCNGRLCQKTLGVDPQGSCQDCIAVAKHGCSSALNCCGGNPCLKNTEADPLGFCRTCVSAGKFGCADPDDCCSPTQCQKNNATEALGFCRACVAETMYGCRNSANCCGGNKCIKETLAAPVGTCDLCIPRAKFGCAAKGDCCDLDVCQKNNTTDAAGTCTQCIAEDRSGCQTAADCCGEDMVCQKANATDVAGVCKKCVATQSYGCMANTECCSSSVQCMGVVPGQCRCAKRDEECETTANCCGGGQTLFCRKDDFLAEKGTCQPCVGNAQYGCSVAVPASCCSQSTQTCVASMGETQCRKNAASCSPKSGLCATEGDCCSGTPPLYCQRTGPADTRGACQTCIANKSFGCSDRSQCCAANDMCDEGVCQCSLSGGPCVSDASCCSDGPNPLFCQRDNPADELGTCQTCITDDKFGCSTSVDNCCTDFMCQAASEGGQACTCSNADGPCVSHGSCCPGETALFCQKDASASAAGNCKSCIAPVKFGCTASTDCCSGNKCQRALATGSGSCETCVAPTFFGCTASADCCSGNKCQRDAANATDGSCQTCIALAKHGCAAGADCCGDNKCQRDTLTDAAGVCATCIALNKTGCAAPADCCAGTKCSKEGSTAAAGTCEACIPDTKYGCTTGADCCNGGTCRKASPTDTFGFCGRCIPDNAYGCAGSGSEDCCTSYLCNSGQCKCSPANGVCLEAGSCCAGVCLREAPGTSPFGNCTNCIPASKHGCVTAASCCTTSNLCQKNSFADPGGLCTTCIQAKKWGCATKDSCCSGGFCAKNATTDATGFCDSCVPLNMWGCADSTDCCGGRMCMKNNPADPEGICVACVGQNKYGCDEALPGACCNDFVCKPSGTSTQCTCSPTNSPCTGSASCCNTTNVCQKDYDMAPSGDCKTCVEAGKFGCASPASCCDTSNFCTKEGNATTGLCSSCVDDNKSGCKTAADCCTPGQFCNAGFCRCSGEGQACTTDTSCCSDGPTRLYCQKDNYLQTLGVCKKCIADSKYGCMETQSCCSPTNYQCGLGLGGQYACRKTFNSRCSVEGDECRDETDCCLGDPEAGEPTLYCQKASATAATGTCEQARCVSTGKFGCDTFDSPLSCCDGLNGPPDPTASCELLSGAAMCKNTTVTTKAG